MDNDSSDRDFLGRGWNFPPTFNNQGAVVQMVEAEEDIRQSLNLLLSTHLGERVMQASFGWKRDALMFEPLSTTFATYLKNEIETAVLFYEPRITLNKVRFAPSSANEGLIEIRLDYTIRTTNTRTNLVFPYYLDEATNV
jgi:phage baseplate assembly protein W